MLNKIIKVANKDYKDFGKESVFEIGSNSDLVLENTITGNLSWTISNFLDNPNQKGYLTFPTKFSMVDSLLNLEHKGKIILRISVNPEDIINKVEFGTSRLKERINAINKLKQANYKVGILIAPVIFLTDWQKLYTDLIKTLYEELSPDVKKDVFFEIIFMTYSFVHTKINEEAFPNSINLYDKNLMTGRGRGKYMYKNELRKIGEIFFKENLNKYFPNNKIMYIV